MTTARPCSQMPAAGYDADVLIVGLGPTGAVLAGLLAQRGLSVIVFDKLPDLYPLPRAVGLDHEVMRIVQELGIVDRILPLTEPYRPSDYRGMDGQLIKRLDATPPPYRTGWAPNFVFNQPEFEHRLRARLTEMPRVRAWYPAEVTAVQQNDQCVWADVAAAGMKHRVTGRYLVACDGGSSLIRKSLGIELEDLGFDEPWLVVDMIVSDEKAKELPQTQVQYCEAARPSTFVTCTGNHRRWEIMLNPGDSLSANFPEDELWPLLRRWIKPGEGRVWRAATYRFHGLIAQEWRKGRILLAGDSAHMTPPFMAQGMVQGIRDAHNLAWKLARVVRRASPDRLLETYAVERRPHVAATTHAAISLGRVICERNPERAKARDAALVAEQDGSIRTTFRQNMIPGLSSGVLARACDDAGVLFPQPTVRNLQTGKHGLLDDLTGSNLRLVTSSVLSQQEARELDERLEPLDGCLVSVGHKQPPAARAIEVIETSGTLGAWINEPGHSFTIVRPDHYVYGTAATARDAMRQLETLSAALGAASRTAPEVMAHIADGFPHE
jgi:3-(3-hydroxy-phenyl)propionate hydroxylase